MTKASGRTKDGLEVDEHALERLEDMCTRHTTEEVRNRLSDRIERRVTYFLNGLDLCTITKEGDKIIEIEKGLVNHPIIDQLVDHE
jgi:hypothetical protein